MGNGEGLFCLSSNPVNSLLQDIQGVNRGNKQTWKLPI